MNNYTAGRLKQLLENIPDDAIINIERIEDIYFEKHGWETKKIIFQEINGVPYEYTNYHPAHSGIYNAETNEVVILAHY